MFSIIDDFPVEIIEPMKALTNKTRRKVLLSLLENDSISYSQIQNSFQVKKGTLNHHLHVLVSSGLIRNFSIESPGNPYNSYYAITDFGRRFVEGLRQTLEPHIEQVLSNIASTAFYSNETVGGASEAIEELELVVATR